MKQFFEILTNIRAASGEILGTASVIFLQTYGAYKAYQDFIAPLFNGSSQRNSLPSSPPQDEP